MLSMFDLWGNTKVPESITIERPCGANSTENGDFLGGGDDCTTVSSAGSSLSCSADELQALNTALCFLVSINADVQEVHAFLLGHPQALLLEGVGPIPEESAHQIAQQQLQRCRCFTPTCKQNRLQVLVALDRGFEYYETERWKQQTSDPRPIPRDYLHELVKLESQIRAWRSEELTLRHRLLETANQVRQHQGELNQVNSQNRRSLLLCTARSDVFAKRNVLEYRVGLATLNLSSVGREHRDLLREIRHGRQEQFDVLKQVFAGCNRHVCATVHTPIKQSPPVSI